jgi:hypothetical protein
MRFRLVESKEDEQKLIDFAGQSLADRFLSLKKQHRLKPPENDLYYWIKNHTPKELSSYLDDIEATKTNSQKRQDNRDHVEHICDTDHYRVYRIKSYEASMQYGRNTRWCVSGWFGDGLYYWNLYTEEREGDFYFLMDRENGDKYAIVIFPGNKYQAFDSSDEQRSLRYIPHIDEVKIPGVDFNSLYEVYNYCESCNQPLLDGEGMYDEDGYIYCESCFFDSNFLCKECGYPFHITKGYIAPDGMYCWECFSEKYFECIECGDTWELENAVETNDGLMCPNCYEKQSK